MMFLKILKLYPILLVFGIIYIECVIGGKTPKPKHKTKLLSLGKCSIPKYPGKEIVSYEVNSRKASRTSTMLSSNITVYERSGPVVYTFLAYQVQTNSERDLIFKLENLDCRQFVVKQVLMQFNVNLEKDCYVLPGNYVTNEVNIDNFNWLFTNAMVGPGKYSYDLKLGTPIGPAMCIRITLDIS